MNPYKTLGVKEAATAQEITKAFKAKILTAHPDHGGSHERCRKLIEAYAMVKTSEARAKTDAWLKEQRRPKAPTRSWPSASARPKAPTRKPGQTPFSWPIAKPPITWPKPSKKPDWKKEAPFAALGATLTQDEPPLVQFAATMAGLWVDYQIAKGRTRP